MKRIPILGIVGWLVFSFLMLPLVVVVLSSFSATGDISFPLPEFSLSAYQQLWSNSEWLTALAVSIGIAVAGSVSSTLVAAMACIVNSRYAYPGKSTLEGAILAPLVIPHAALAIALFSVVRSAGLLGSYWGILIAHIVITLPFAYRPLITSMRKYDRSFDEAGMSLGASPVAVFWTVTMPVMRPAFVTALLFTFIISFDEATVTLFLKGPQMTTLPVKIFSEMQEGTGFVVPAVSTLLISLTIGFILVIDRFIGVDMFVNEEVG